MNSLNRLLRFQFRHTLWQSMAICAILACGIAIFVMATSTLRSLEYSCERFYEGYKLADIFVHVRRAPNSLAKQIAQIPNVSEVHPRIVQGVLVDLQTIPEPATALVSSIPDDPASGLNRVHIQQGYYPDPSGSLEVIVSEQFAKANRLHPGGTLEATIGGRKERLRIAGIGMSPEFVYPVRAGEFMADNRRFGIIWMPHRQAEAAFDMVGAFNDISLKTNSPNSHSGIIAEVDRLTRRYGGQGAYDRSEQVSYRRLADELYQLRGMAIIMPLIFLLVAAFLVNMVLARIVHRQQEQIATLRAFGYTAREIAWHYVKYVAVLMSCGTALGVVVGMMVAVKQTETYGEFFRFPRITNVVAYDSISISLLVSALVGFFGSASALLRAIRLPPAVAMRPEAPGVYRSSFLEKLGLGWLLSPVSLMILRRLERNKRSTLLSILSMSLAVAILVLGSFFEDTIDYIIHVQFEEAQRQDLTVAFAERVSPEAKYELQHMPGVQQVEPFRTVPVRLQHGAHVRLMSLMGLENPPRLFRVLDEQHRDVEIPSQGLVISQKLAEILGVTEGDRLNVEFLTGESQTRSVEIAAVFPNYTDPVAVIDRSALHGLLGEGECLSGVFLSIDTAFEAELFDSLKAKPSVASVSSKQAVIDGFNETLAESLRRMRTINGIFAAIIAFGTFYNCALITLAERSRDLATLRILGMTRGEVSRILLGELAVMTLVSIPIGLPLGYILSDLTTTMMDTESHRIPLVIERGTFAYASIFIIVAAAVSAAVVRTMMDRLDLLAVLKAKE